MSYLSSLEAILFLYGEPIKKDALARLLHASIEETDRALQDLEKELIREERGLMLMQKGDTYALVTKSQFSSLLEQFVKDSLKEELTPAAVETLSLVAYFGPIARAQIDYVRGVNSSFILRALLVRGLVDRTQKGNAYVYEVSADFLKHMGVAKVEDLAQYKEYHETKEKLFSQEQEAPIANPDIFKE